MTVILHVSGFWPGLDGIVQYLGILTVLAITGNPIQSTHSRRRTLRRSRQAIQTGDPDLTANRQ